MLDTEDVFIRARQPRPHAPQQQQQQLSDYRRVERNRRFVQWLQGKEQRWLEQQSQAQSSMAHILEATAA